MKNSRFLFSGLLLLFVISLSGQNGLDGMRKNAISVNALGTSPFVGVTYERIISPKGTFEIGVGIPSVGIGFKLYPSGIEEQKLLFHVGATANVTDLGDGVLIGGTLYLAYVPVGISFFSSGGFNFGLDVGPSLVFDEDESTFIPYGNLKLGYRF